MLTVTYAEIFEKSIISIRFKYAVLKSQFYFPKHKLI